MRKPHWEVMQEDIARYSFKIPDVGVVVPQGLLHSLAVTRFLILDQQRNGGDAVAKAKVYRRDPSTFGSAILPRVAMGDVPPEGVNDEHFRNAGEMSVYALFQQGGAPIYKLARDFGEQLAKVDLEISPHHIPSLGSFVCIEFPDHIRYFDKDNDDYFHCAYVGADTPNGLMQDIEGGSPVKIVKIVLPCFDADGKLKLQANMFTLTFRANESTIAASMERAQKYSSHPITDPSVYLYILKALIYLSTGDPDLRQYRAPRPPTSEKAKKLRRWFKDHENRSLVDMTLVGYDFKKPRVYHVGEVQVTGHFRWQPYGAKTDPKVKLIWIEPYVKNFKNEEEQP